MSIENGVIEQSNQLEATTAVASRAFRSRYLIGIALSASLFAGANTPSHEAEGITESTPKLEQTLDHDSSFSIFDTDSISVFSEIPSPVTTSEQAADDSLVSTTSKRLGNLSAGIGAASTSVLTPIKLLPGYHDKTTKKVREKQVKSAVQLINWEPGDDAMDSFSEFCSGNIVDFADSKQNYVMTARHCFEGKTVFNDSTGANNTASDLPESIDENNDYGLLIYDRESSPSNVLHIDEISIADSEDIALAKLNISDKKLKKLGLTAKRINPDQVFPKPGAEVSLMNFPAAAWGNMVKKRGVYLGVGKDPSRIYTGSHEFMFIGLRNVPSPVKDACNFGSSGSLAYIGKKGYPTGPLAGRVNAGYANGELQPEDAMVAPWIDDHKRSIEYQTGVEVPGDVTTLCYQTLIEPSTIVSLRAALQN